MKLINKTEIKLENYEKCSLFCDNDCPLGALYDYSCALKAFIIEKMKEVEEVKKQPEESKNEQSG